MSGRTYMTPELEAEVKQWVGRLLAGAGQNRQQAASELSRLGVWTRGSVRTRGTLSTPRGSNCQATAPEPASCPPALVK